jgi:2-polyprenyl-6-methoxyphenol hydroxylase-like FAD-dependent oxidoreductase
VSTHHPIAIIGAGLGGLMTARVLHLAGIEAAVFDLESDRHARVQGGMLDIHDYNGQIAIRAAGLWDRFLELIHQGGEATRILDHRATVLREEVDDGELSRPEVDRGQLRDLLIDPIPEDSIRWGKKVTAVAARRTGGHSVEFADGTAITTDVLIGADGAWSKVRTLLTPVQPEYAGVSFIEADLHDVDTAHPQEADVVGAGMLFALNGNTGILAHRETDGSIHVYLGYRSPAEWVDSIDVDDRAASTTAVLQLLDGWDPALQGLIRNADGALVPRRINVLPIGLQWNRTPGVTLLGDAAHVMSPFAGEGANLAMLDGAELAQHLAAQPDDVEAAFAAYEQDLFPRARAAAQESADNLALIFSDDSPVSLVRLFESFDDDRGASAPPGTHDS